MYPSIKKNSNNILTKLPEVAKPLLKEPYLLRWVHRRYLCICLWTCGALDLIDPGPENYWSKTLPDISEKIKALLSVQETKLLETKRTRSTKK